MNSVEIAESLINRAKNLQLFEVKRPIKDGIFFDGQVPFDMKADRENAWFKVYATNLEEAEAQVDNWLGWRT